MENNNDDITLVFNLPFDGMCLFLEGMQVFVTGLESLKIDMQLKRIDSKVGIRIGTIGIPDNTHQVITFQAQTDVPLQ